MEEILEEDSALSHAYKALERAYYSAEQLLEYDRYAWKEEEIQTRIDDARLEGEKAGEEKGRAEGIEQGRAEGIEQGRAEERAKAEKELAEQKAKAEAKETSTVKNLLKLGLSVEQIASATGLTASEIEAIKIS